MKTTKPNRDVYALDFFLFFQMRRQAICFKNSTCTTGSRHINYTQIVKRYLPPGEGQQTV